VLGGRVTTLTRPISPLGPAGFDRPAGELRPAEDLADRLRTLRPDQPFRFAIDLLAPQTGRMAASWVSPAEAAARMLARAGADAAAGSITGAVAGRVMAGIVLGRRVPDIRPGSLILRLGPTGRLEQTAVTSPIVAMLGHDPMSGHADAHVLPDDDALLGWAAAATIEVLEPVLASLAEAGLEHGWDLVAGSALEGATAVRADATPLALAFVDALIARGAPIWPTIELPDTAPADAAHHQAQPA
jgi:hypothetical protein